MDSEPPAEKNETSNRGTVHVDCLISTQEQRPMENGTTNVFLTSALTPRSPAVFELFIQFSTFRGSPRVSSFAIVSTRSFSK
ncbi:unnamed protein product [Euphydryas editha]|uniref:Uncharacterized protein n=1 Tax=Euphydryas editha TaxID=104508 RepID=A0AAU9TR93_EUPED|nr:unnamed protein product [Euphydryas editha]